MFKVRRIFHRAKEKTKGESKVLPISVLKVAEEEDKNNAAQNNQRLIEINPEDEADQTTNSPNKLVLATPQSHGKLMVTNVTNDEGFLKNLKTNKGSICSFVGTGDQNDILVHRTLVDIQNEAVSRYEKAANSIKVPISEDYVFAPPTLDGKNKGRNYGEYIEGFEHANKRYQRTAEHLYFTCKSNIYEPRFMHCFDVAGGVPQPVPDTSFHLESVGVMDGETANLPQTHFVLAVNKNTARGKGTTMRTKFTFMAFNAEEAADWCEKIRYWSVGNHESLFSGEDIVEDYSDFHITIKRNRNTNHLNKIEGPHNNISIGSGHPLRNVSRLAITDAANTNEYHNITLKKDVLSISRTNINGPDMLKEFESNSAVIRRSGVYEAETTDFDLNGASETVKKFTSIRYSGSSTPAAPLLVDGYMHVQPADSNSLYNERVLRIPNNRFISENNLESLPQSSRGQSYGLPLNNPKGMSENSGQSIPYQAHHVSAAFSEKTDTSAFENPELQEKNQTQLQALPAKNQYLCDSGQPKSPQPTVNSQTHGSSRIKYVNDTHGLYNPGSDTSSQSQKNLHNNANFYANTPESHTYIETKSTKNTDYANSLSSKLDLSSKRRNVKYADNPDDIDSVSTELPPHNPVLKKPTNQNNKPSNPVENGGSPTTSVKYKTDYDENHLVNDEDVECQSNSRSIAFDTSNSGSTRSKNKQDLIIQTNKIYTPRNSSDKYNGHYSSRRGSDTIYTGNRTANRDSSSKAIYLKDLLLSDRLSTTPIDDSTAINAQNIIMQNISNVDLSFPLNGTLDVESYELSTKITRQSTDEILSLSKYSLPNTDPVYNDGISRYTTRNTKKKTTFSNINDSGEEGTNIEISTEAASYNKKVGLVGASFFK
ncbi:hypothetical protein AX774_g192 [Zancudomyces culisetae]|uniref:PH domain-containing protein n=1 Tax=Zancudomyces culisetae TaxID=1213189 RepID=A0A1R1PZB8_ZANCU|nr:hypothetical protein AX774_g192 [Zancudomyces culisetae]|eukprot:OMH86300.1 hypothetical protein AX774_g192 [Zancudomyces culisetae]